MTDRNTRTQVRTLHRVFEPHRRRYAGQIVTIEVDETTLRIYDQRDHLIQTVPRTSSKEVRRHKAYGRTTNHTTG